MFFVINQTLSKYPQALLTHVCIWTFIYLSSNMLKEFFGGPVYEMDRGLRSDPFRKNGYAL